MKVIVFAYAKENHTAPVKWALEQAGYQVACWGGLSWTEQQQASLLLDAQAKQTKMTLGPFTVEAGDAVWISRRTILTYRTPTGNSPKWSIAPFTTVLRTRWKPFLSGASTSFQRPVLSIIRQCN